MLRNLCLLLTVAVATGRAWCEATSTPATPGEFLQNIPYEKYIDANSEQPPGTVFDIRTYGAVGDGQTLNTAAISQAIGAATAAGGGVVLIDEGDYVSGTLTLASHVTLKIGRKGVLRASRRPSDYDPLHFIQCEKATDVRIEGPGKIAGEGDAWWNPPRTQPPQSPPEVFRLAEARSIHGLAKRKKVPGRPSPLIRFRLASDVVVTNLIIENSPGWTLMLDHCDRASIQGVVINNNYHGENTDGIDVVGSNDVDISRCFISTGDDGIVLKNGFAGEGSRPMSNVRISRCTVRSAANGIKIGTETWSDITHVAVRDCEIFTEEIWPWCLSGIAIESVDGAQVRDITVEDVTTRSVMAPLFVRLGNRNRWKDKDHTGSIEQIVVKNLRATNAVSPCVISGIPGLPIRNVTLDGIELTYHDTMEELELVEPVPELEDGYPEFWNFGDLPAHGLYARHVDGLVVRGLTSNPRAVNKREMVVLEDVMNATVH